MIVQAQQHDNLDAIVYRYFGNSQGLLERTLALNPHLLAQPILTVGTPVHLPDADTEKINVAQDTLQLWS